MIQRSATLIILISTLSTVNLSCGQDGDPHPGGDSAHVADGASQQDTSPGADGGQPVPDAAPPSDTASTPDMKRPPDAGKPCNPALQGTYTAPFSLKAEEKLGGSVINKMSCSGTLTTKVACGQVPVMQGSYTCDYTGGLVVFDKKQPGTIQGDVDASGGFTGKITHSYSGSLKKTYSATGTVSGGKITGGGNGTVKPSPKGVVAWKVTFSF